MATESESEPNNQAMSRATEHYIDRARVILDDPSFKARLKQARKEWNRDWPAYRIGPPDPRIPNPANTTRGDLPLPRRLAEAVDQEVEDIEDVVNDWDYRAHMLAHEEWPRHLYSDWRGHGFPHPAKRFVAACLIWDSDRINPKKWIEPIPYTALVQSIPFDPTIPPAIPEVARWKTAFETLSALLTVRSDEGFPLTPEESAALIEQARQQGDEMEKAASKYATMTNPEGFQFVRVHPRMKSPDWRLLEPIVIRTRSTTSRSNPLHDEARRLRAEGVSIAQIARQLGKHWTTIADWIKDEERGGADS